MEGRRRPQSIGTIFTYRLGGKINRKHEFHSLALAPLSAAFGGKTVWSPRTAGVTFQRLDKAPAVAATSRQRLTQMKSMAACDCCDWLPRKYPFSAGT